MLTHALIGLAAALALPACAAAGTIPQSAGEGGRAASAAAAQPEPMFDSADALLDELERADDNLRTLQSKITYMRIKALELSVESRFGRLYFTAEPAPGGAPPRRTFTLDFAQRWVGNTRASDARSVIVFDGERLHEKDFAQKLMIVRTVVEPGAEGRDPMRLGEGPLPIPIGQKKADILAHYEARIVSDLTDGLQAAPDAEPMEARIYDTVREEVSSRPGKTVQLLLKARGEGELTEVRLWYRRAENGRLLPIAARAVAHDGDISIIQLADIRVNEPLDPAAKEAMSTRAPGGWVTERRD